MNHGPGRVRDLLLPQQDHRAALDAAARAELARRRNDRQEPLP